ncbi:MAG TPA: SurA N-terminal domain-containing protein, partial [Verrucomicrobiae bacterium]|nr:SurA N-terminal domain-containing protein [Verrucomicrobiae bacterium]
MFGTIRRHQGWLMVVFAAVTIVSFVIFGPTNSRLGNVLKEKGGAGTLAGQAITPGQYINAQKEVALNYFLENNQWPDHATELKPGFNEARETYVRLFLIQKQKELGIEIGPDAVLARARQMLGSMPADDFVEKILKPERLDYDDFERYIRHNLGIQQLFMTAAMSGTLVTPQEAETLYRNEHRDMATAAVFFSASNYLAGVTVTPADLAQFYTNQLANYRIPNRVEVNYVKYNVSNYLAAAKASLTNVDQIIDQNYKKYATNAESRATLKENIIRGHALQDAGKAANAFAVELYDMPPGTNRAGNLEELAKK